VESHTVQYGSQLLHVCVLLEHGGLCGGAAGAALGRAGLRQLQQRGLQLQQVVSARLYCRVPEGSGAGVGGGLVAGLAGVGVVAQTVPVLELSSSRAVGRSLAAVLELTASGL
jgi:hypothetical protein